MEHRNNRDSSSRDITHKQLIGKQISYKPYRRIASFNGYFYEEDFLDWLLDLKDLFDYENICNERTNFLCKNLVNMPYIGGNDYNLIESNKVKTNFIHGQR